MTGTGTQTQTQTWTTGVTTIALLVLRTGELKMVGRSVDKKDEIWAYIKACSKLGCSLKKLMTEISTAFGPSCVSYDTVRG